MIIPRALVDRIVAQARAELPNECCGMISGSGSTAEAVHPAANTESSPFMYVMDPKEQLRIMDEIDEAGADLVAIYHSHTRSAPYPSRTDVELAFYPEAVYLIVSVARPDDPEARAFRIDRSAPEGGQIREEPLEVI